MLWGPWKGPFVINSLKNLSEDVFKVPSISLHTWECSLVCLAQPVLTLHGCSGSNGYSSCWREAFREFQEQIYPHPVTKICNRKYCVKTLRERSFQFKRHYITLRYIILSLRKLHFQLYNAISSKIVHLSTWNFVHLLQNLLTIYAENFIYLSQKMAKLHKKRGCFFWPTLYMYIQSVT